MTEKTLVLPEAKKLQMLADILHTIDSTNNKITVQDFEKFQVLFRKPDPENPISEDTISVLSTQFMEIIDPYKPIDITANDNIIVTLPALYTPLEPIEQQYALYVDANHAMGDSDIPKYRDEALFNMANKLFESQLSDNNIARIRANRIKYAELQHKFQALKSGKQVEQGVEEESDIVFEEWE